MLLLLYMAEKISTKSSWLFSISRVEVVAMKYGVVATIV
jgi:hypothetical protein